MYGHERISLCRTTEPLCKQLLPHTLDALATAHAIGTAYRHFPYESAQRSCMVHALKKLTFYGRTTLMDTGVLHLRLRAYDAYGYGRIAATTTGVLQAYYGLAAGCKLTSGHYSCNRER